MKIPLALALLLTLAAASVPASTSLLPKIEARALSAAAKSSTECIPCDVLFSELRSTDSGRRVQEVQMQLRGEPKSGTGFIHQWASGMLYHACEFLQRSFGKDTCRMAWESEDPEEPTTYTNRSLIFEPELGGADAPCSCLDVDRVTISVSKRNKHTLPVDPSCSWWRPNAIVGHRSNDRYGCKDFKGSVVSNYSDLVGCIQEAACEITDDRLQLVILRDPRAIAVSSYFYRRNGRVISADTTLEEYVPQILPGICKWISIRYVLFSGLLLEKSTIFWYNDSVARPIAWHRRFSDSVGLHLPATVVDEAIDAALRGEFAFHSKGMDMHSESSKEAIVTGRTWEDEIRGNHDLLAELDATLRVWLPPVLLAKLGLALAV